MTPFGHITDWIFDLDNTLYPRECDLFVQIDVRITHYVMEVASLDFAAARALQKDYYRDFGTTLAGLMARHGVDPDHYLSTVHAIDYSPVMPHPELVAAIEKLPGRKFIFTNADAGHASAVLDKLGGGHLFEAVFDIRAAAYRPKPLREAYEAFLLAHGVSPQTAIMFDDLEKNLLVPHESGMTTVQVVAGPGFTHLAVESWELDQGVRPHVHHTTHDLVAFLGRIA